MKNSFAYIDKLEESRNLTDLEELSEDLMTEYKKTYWDKKTTAWRQTYKELVARTDEAIKNVLADNGRDERKNR